MTAGVLTHIGSAGATWEGTDDFSSGISTVNWTIYSYVTGQMQAVGTHGHVSYVVPGSATTVQSALILWKGTPTAADDWTVDIRAHNEGYSFKLRVFDTATLGFTNYRSFVLQMRYGDSAFPMCFETVYWPGGSANHNIDRKSAPATNSTVGLRLAHRGGVNGAIEAWYDPSGTGTDWTLLDMMRMADFSSGMAPSNTFSIAVQGGSDYGPITEGRLWADDFRITNTAIGNFAPQTTLVKAVTPTFSNLMVGTNYQLQLSSDMNAWTNQGAPFTATNFDMAYPQYWNVDNWGHLFFRLQVAP